MFKKEGIYINYHSGVNQWGENFQLTSFLFLTEHNLIFYEDRNGKIDPEEIKNYIFSVKPSSIPDKKFGIYDISGSNVTITVPTMGIEHISNNYRKFRGFFYGTAIVLDYELCNWSEMKNEYFPRTLIKDMEFHFYSFKERNFIYAKDKSETPKPISDAKIESIIQDQVITSHNNERNGAIAFVFGLVGAVIGLMAGGGSGLFIGLIIGVIIGFILKAILDS